MNGWPGALALLLLLAVSFFFGTRWVQDDAQARITAAEDSRRACGALLETNAAALERVRSTLAAERERHARALAAAREALDVRDAQIQSLKADADARVAAIREAIDDSPDVAALARLPVPAALAGQLWPPADRAPAAARGGD